MSEKIVPRSQNYSRWYTDVIQRAELADYAPVRGCMVIRPYGYALWENIRGSLDQRFKRTGAANAYFPLFIPQSYLQRESEHVEGFSPELAVVTYGGGKELEEPLIVRPTSETIINSMFAKWVQSYRDLPLMINQWCNVVRWEMRTKLFLRTTEFLWQEGHTAHATAEEAREETERMLEVYRDFSENEAAVPVIAGRKSENEKFAGAVDSYSIEAMMGDKRALQAATSHNLGQNFARPFDIQYLDQNNELQYVWQTSWGLSTRFIGAIIMVHGDDQGLILPPRLAPIQMVIVPIWRSEEQRRDVMAVVEEVQGTLADGLRVEVDDQEGHTPGWKFNHWEMKGVPLRIEVGPRDVEQGQVVLARRDQPGQEGKVSVPMDELAQRAPALLEEIQANLLARAREFMERNTAQPRSYEEFKEVVAHGFARAWWCGDSECEDQIQEETQATVRCIPLDQPEGSGRCIRCGKPAKKMAIFARAY
ncbi:MAG: proline--tRNA ligase [Chloroflexota bacterium]|nr:proline--tRNA ligase [Chloroflexota bacterium]